MFYYENKLFLLIVQTYFQKIHTSNIGTIESDFSDQDKNAGWATMEVANIAEHMVHQSFFSKLLCFHSFYKFFALLTYFYT